MNLPNHKTKIVCTIGPGCRSLVMMEAMIKAGMNVARLNFSHADFTEHNENILNLRKASLKLNRYVNIFIDLPGSKMRLGKLAKPLTVTPGQRLILTNAKVSEGDARIPVDFHRFSQSAIKGNIVYINDGFIQLLIEKVSKLDVHCKVLVGGTMSSHKGINLPNAKLNLNAITPKDYECIAFGLSHGVKTYGISFVESAEDVRKVREFAKRKGSNVYLVAKIERREAINNIDAILKEADGIMIARGDLGVEIPIEEVPIVQKKLIAKANALGKPVITATQMLESMTQNVRPTRAEANDVTNAILDGTDAIMLSGETAVGKYPIETITVMCQIAAYTESQRDSGLISNDETQHTREAVIQGHYDSRCFIIKRRALCTAFESEINYHTDIKWKYRASH